MSEIHNEVRGYDWWQANPSQEKALPVILGGVFDEGQECAWMKERSYENEQMFHVLEKFYHTKYPRLFTQLAAFAVVRAHTPAIFEDIENTMKHYNRGAVAAVLSLEASMPLGYFRDLTPQYAERYVDLDMLDIEAWLLFMRASTTKQTEQLRGFIVHDYEWLNEPDYLKTAMHIGAQHTYILMAHNRHCVEREQEIAWMTRDDESFEGWIQYIEDNYSGLGGEYPGRDTNAR